MTARLPTHLDLDQVEDTPWACGPYTRRALVAATRALIAVVDWAQPIAWETAA